MTAKSRSLLDHSILVPALAESFRKLNPRIMMKNPVMFVTEIGAALTTIDCIIAATHLAAVEGEPLGVTLQISIWLWP